LSLTLRPPSAIIRGVRFVVTKNAEQFARRAGPLLEGRIECNLLATVLANVLDRGGGYTDSAPVFAWGLEGPDRVRFAALRAPPWCMLASELDAGCAPSLLAAWLAVDPELPGVDSVPPTARAIATAWADQTGGVTRCRMSEAMHALEEVQDPPRPASGRLRLAQDPDRAQLTDWMAAFAVEVGLQGDDLAGPMVDARMAHGGLLVWDRLGPVSMVGVTRPVAGVVRLGPVYTPPEHRCNGYAGSAVAAASRRALERGAIRCMLFTDLSNPTSNKIYAEVGYRRTGGWEEHAFNRG
jgi:GNAT superfamily N-acetyltransferase